MASASAIRVGGGAVVDRRLEPRGGVLVGVAEEVGDPRVQVLVADEVGRQRCALGHRLQRGGHVDGVRRALPGVLRQQGAHQELERIADPAVGRHPGERRGLLGEVAQDRLRGRALGERRRPRDHLEDEGAKGVQVGARVDGAAEQLLGRREGRGGEGGEPIVLR
jgi:hypothetical protein